jgi:outer membrane immunogenic protein
MLGVFQSSTYVMPVFREKYMRRAILPILLLAGAGATPAFGQDGEPGGFTGPRVEFFGGANRTLPDRDSVGAVPTTSRTPKHTGGIAGVQVGYDASFGGFVAGAFGSYSLQTPNGCGNLVGLNQGCLQPGRQIEAGGRVGFQFMDRVLLYGKAAYVNTSVRTKTLRAGAVDTDTVRLDGWRVGGGAEYSLNRNTYVKAEYDYGRTNKLNAGNLGFPNTRVDYHQHSGIVGFGIRF